MSCYIAVDTKQQCQDGRCQTNMITMEIGMTADQFIRDPLPATDSLFESERRGIYTTRLPLIGQNASIFIGISGPCWIHFDRKTTNA